jgi:Uma2 family endonuclease
MTVTSLMTADELLQLPDDEFRYELVRGELRKMSPTCPEHGDVAMLIAYSLHGHVKKHRLGKVYINDVGFWIERNPDTVRGPDIAFLQTARVVKSRKFYEGPPDLAIEVVSPSDSYTEVEEKATDLLRAGTRAVIVVDPARRSVRIHRASKIFRSPKFSKSSYTAAASNSPTSSSSITAIGFECVRATST